MNRIPFTQQMMFAKVMEDEDICREFLKRLFPERKVRNVKVHKPEKHIVESELSQGILSKAVRLDVQFDDEEGWHDIEMQVEERPEIPKRSRYYSAIIDVKHLKIGESYLTLKASYVIFICMYDPYKLGEPIYFFERCDMKQNLKMGDESYIIMLNAKCEDNKVPEPLRGLFAYLKKGAVGEDSLVSQIDRRVELYQKDGEVLHMATLEEHIRWEREFIANMAAEVESKRAEVANMAAKVESEKAKVESEKAKVESMAAKVESEKAEIENRAAEIESRRAELERREAEIEKKLKLIEVSKEK